MYLKMELKISVVLYVFLPEFDCLVSKFDCGKIVGNLSLFSEFDHT